MNNDSERVHQDCLRRHWAHEADAADIALQTTPSATTLPMDSEKELQHLLSSAGSRPEPPNRAAARAYAELREEWRTLVVSR